MTFAVTVALYETVTGCYVGRIHVLLRLFIRPPVPGPGAKLRGLQCRPFCTILHHPPVLLLHGMAQGLAYYYSLQYIVVLCLLIPRETNTPPHNLAVADPGLS